MFCFLHPEAKERERERERCVAELLCVCLCLRLLRCFLLMKNQTLCFIRNSSILWAALFITFKRSLSWFIGSFILLSLPCKFSPHPFLRHTSPTLPIQHTHVSMKELCVLGCRLANLSTLIPNPCP